MTTDENTRTDAIRDIRRTVEYIRRNDCDFLTAETLSAYTGHSEDVCRDIMVNDLGMDPELVA